MRSFFAKTILLATVLGACAAEPLEGDAADSTPKGIPTGTEGSPPATGTGTAIQTQPARVSSDLTAAGAAKLGGTFRHSPPPKPTDSSGSNTGSTGGTSGPTTATPSTGTDTGPATGDNGNGNGPGTGDGGGDEIPEQLTDKITLRDPAQVEARRVAL